MFVDAGYLLSAGAWAAVGSWRRAETRARIPELLAWLKAEAVASSEGRELLRVYWYDAAPRREPEAQHREVARQPDTKIRLGSLNRFGQQKGVDALLLADMLDLAASRTLDTVMVVSGDEDLLEAVKRVQAQGLRVVLWGVDTPNNTLSVELRYEADRVRLLTGGELAPFFERLGPPGAEEGSGHAAAVVAGAGGGNSGPAPVVPAGQGTARSRATLPPPPAVKPRWMEMPIAEPAGPAPVGGSAAAGERPVTYADADPATAAAAARAFAAELAGSGTDLSPLLAERPQIPQAVDSRLLRHVIRSLEVAPDDQLDFDIRSAIRNSFWAELDRHASST